MDGCKPTERSEVVRCRANHRLELRGRIVHLAESEQRMPECHARGQETGMVRQPVTADAHRLGEVACAPMFLGDLREGDG